MKTTAAIIALTSVISLTQGTPIVKRADANEAATIGFATLNGGTTGGAGGPSTTVTTLAALKACASTSGPAICIVSGTISGGDTVRVASDTTIVGANSAARLNGIGLTIKGSKSAKVSNVIVRNLSISKVLATNGDAIGVQFADNVWVDHVDLEGDRAQPDKDLYDGLFDVTHASDFITLSNSVLHNHWKGVLVGHSDSNGAEDTGHLTVSFANNVFSDINSRGPSVRFGTAHVFNTVYEKIGDGINTRLGAQVLVESNVFTDVKKPLYSVDNDGFAVANDNNFGGGKNEAPAGNVAVPYEYSLLGSGNVKAAVVGNAGATLTF